MVLVYDAIDCVPSDDRGPVRRRLADLIRDAFGDPFRPVAFAPEWWPPTAAARAARMYESRDFTALPALAIALRDAGCEDAAVLAHCRARVRTSEGAG